MKGVVSLNGIVSLAISISLWYGTRTLTNRIIQLEEQVIRLNRFCGLVEK